MRAPRLRSDVDLLMRAVVLLCAALVGGCSLLYTGDDLSFGDQPDWGRNDDGQVGVPGAMAMVRDPMRVCIPPPP